MFFETYQISRELTEQLLHRLYQPCREQVIETNRILEKHRANMKVEKINNGERVEFADLDLSFLDNFMPETEKQMKEIKLGAKYITQFSLSSKTIFAA